MELENVKAEKLRRTSKEISCLSFVDKLNLLANNIWKQKFELTIFKKLL